MALIENQPADRDIHVAAAQAADRLGRLLEVKLNPVEGQIFRTEIYKVVREACEGIRERDRLVSRAR
jgi:hypothetical protein